MIINELHIFLGGCLQGFEQSPYGLVVGLFLVGLVGGFTHCVAMCGPFVMAQSHTIEKLSDAALLPYHLGRIITYTLLAVIFYSIVNIVSFFAPLRLFVVVPLLSVAGVLFLVNGLPRLQGVFPWISKMRLPISVHFVQSLFPKTSNRFITGLILGLMPCGMVMGALMASATAPDMVTAALAMASFGLGTFPALLLMALGGHHLQRKYPRQMHVIRSGFMVWSGLWLCIMAGMMVLRG